MEQNIVLRLGREIVRDLVYIYYKELSMEDCNAILKMFEIINKNHIRFDADKIDSNDFCNWSFDLKELVNG